MSPSELNKQPFSPIETHVVANGQSSQVRITRAETPEELLLVPALERQFFFEQRKGDTGYVYSDDEVIDLHRFGEFFLIWSLDVLIGYTSLSIGTGNNAIGVQDTDAYYAGSMLHPTWRRNGLSKTLNGLREERARLYGSSRAITCLVANNRSSIAALTKAGFVISDAVRSVFSANEAVNGDRLVLTKVLGQGSQLEFSEIPAKEGISLSNAAFVFERISNLLEEHKKIVSQRIADDGSEIVIEYL